MNNLSLGITFARKTLIIHLVSPLPLLLRAQDRRLGGLNCLDRGPLGHLRVPPRVPFSVRK